MPSPQGSAQYNSPFAEMGRGIAGYALDSPAGNALRFQVELFEHEAENLVETEIQEPSHSLSDLARDS